MVIMTVLIVYTDLNACVNTENKGVLLCESVHVEDTGDRVDLFNDRNS